MKNKYQKDLSTFLTEVHPMYINLWQKIN
jgi:hypothetical protein